MVGFERVERKGIGIGIRDGGGGVCLSKVGVYDGGNVCDWFVEKVEEIECVG